ncbi:MAG: hypothetical protein KF850_08115 [Labilithrix sp.]|nr:hypothetical protein [Labilithrix sp.]
MIRRSLGLGAFVVASLVFACGSSSTRDGFGDDPGAGNGADLGGGDNNKNDSLGTDPTPEQPAPPEECQKMDILFVIDDSGSMQEEQANLVANFPKFVSKIDSFKTKSGSKLDWRIAVTTTGRDVAYQIQLPIGGGSFPQNEKGDNGVFRMTPSCGTTKRWVEKADATAAKDFQCLARVGTSGPSIEMPLEATKLALVDRMADGTNTGFLRDDALLAIVILTDEDDCSRDDNNFTIQNDVCKTMQGLKPISEYKGILDAVAKGAGRWATAVIAGPTACQSSFGKASEAARLQDFVGMAGKNGTFSSICDGDLSDALEKALDTFDAACKTLPPSSVK